MVMANGTPTSSVRAYLRHAARRSAAQRMGRGWPGPRQPSQPLIERRRQGGPAEAPGAPPEAELQAPPPPPAHRRPMEVPVTSMELESPTRVSASLIASARLFSSARCGRGQRQGALSKWQPVREGD